MNESAASGNEFEIAYTLPSTAWSEHWKRVHEQAAPIRRWHTRRRLYELGTAWLAVPVLAWAGWHVLGRFDRDMALFGAVLGGVFAVIWAMYVFKRPDAISHWLEQLRQAATPLPPSAETRPIEIRLAIGPHQLRWRWRDWDVRTSWKSVLQVAQTEDLLAIEFENMEPYLVPRAAFSEQMEFEAFARAAENFYARVWGHEVSPLAIYLGREGATCPRCGYNLQGLRKTSCPECGLPLFLPLLKTWRAWSKR